MSTFKLLLQSLLVKMFLVPQVIYTMYCHYDDIRHHHHANSMCTQGGTVLVVYNFYLWICSLSWKGNRVFKLLIVELHLDVVISHNGTVVSVNIVDA